MAGGKVSWLRRVFVNRNILYLWSGQVISQAGDTIFEIGLVWLLLDLTGSNQTTGLIAMSAYLPTLLFGFYSGALVDRFDRRHLMLVADLARALVVLLIPLLFWLDGLSGLILGLLTFALASFNTLFNPARDAYVGQLVQRKQRMAANSLIQTSWQYAMFLGPVAATVILAFVGQVHLFTVDALTFLISFWFIYKIKATVAGRQPQPRRPLGREIRQSWRDVGAGLRYARQDKRVWGLLVITAVDNLFLMGPALIGAPIFVREILHQGAGSYALVQAAYALGMLAGTLLLNRFGGRFASGKIILAGIIFDGLSFFPLLWVSSVWGMFVTIAIHAMAIPLIIVTRPTIILNIVPDEMQGRIFSMMSVAVYGLTAVSVALTGAVSEIIPINVVYALIAILAAASGAVGWLIPEFRSME